MSLLFFYIFAAIAIAGALGMVLNTRNTVAAALSLVLTMVALGGVYVAGGIAPRLKDVFVASPFRAKFEAKGRYTEFMSRIPTWLVLDEVPAFLGLAAILDERMIGD